MAESFSLDLSYDPAAPSPPLAPMTVEQCAAVPDALVNALQTFSGFRCDASQFGHSPDGLLQYVRSIRSFAEALVRAVPRTCFAFNELPLGRSEFLRPYVVEFLIQLAS